MAIHRVFNFLFVTFASARALDTALSSGEAVFPTLKAFAGERILFGSDFPYAPAHVASRFTDKLDLYEGITAAERSMINRGKALKVFPRLRHYAA